MCTYQLLSVFMVITAIFQLICGATFYIVVSPKNLEIDRTTVFVLVFIICGTLPELPDHANHLADSNFIVRILFKNNICCLTNAAFHWARKLVFPNSYFRVGSRGAPQNSEFPTWKYDISD